MTDVTIIRVGRSTVAAWNPGSLVERSVRPEDLRRAPGESQPQRESLRARFERFSRAVDALTGGHSR